MVTSSVAVFNKSNIEEDLVQNGEHPTTISGKIIINRRKSSIFDE